MSKPAMTAALSNARWGLIFVSIYFAFYAIFIAVNAFAPEQMGQPWIGGVNVAIWAGLGLIAGACALALVYLYKARDHEEGDAQ